MTLREFFVEEIGIPEKCWDDNESSLPEIVGDAVYEYVKWIYGYEKYERHSWDIEAGLLVRLERRDPCLSFLAREILRSELKHKAVILEELTDFALKSPDVDVYPIFGVINLLARKNKLRESSFEWLLVWKDTLSEEEDYGDFLELTIDGELRDATKAAILLGVLESLIRRRWFDQSRKIVMKFFESDLSVGFKREVAQLIVDPNFINSLTSVHILALPETFKGKVFGLPVKEVTEKLLKTYDSELSVEIAYSLVRRRDIIKPTFNPVREAVTKWLLSSLGDAKRKDFIRERLGKDYRRNDDPMMKGILRFLRGGREKDDKFAREVIDELKDANRYQIRLETYKAAHVLFPGSKSKYIEEAATDRAKTIRGWAEEMSSEVQEDG